MQKDSEKSLQLGLSIDEQEILKKNIMTSDWYSQMQQKMHAIVLLCTQEMVSPPEVSGLKKFEKKPINETKAQALSLAYSFLKQKGLNVTLSALEDEAPKGALDQVDQKITWSGTKSNLEEMYQYLQ